MWLCKKHDNDNDFYYVSIFIKLKNIVLIKKCAHKHI